MGHNQPRWGGNSRWGVGAAWGGRTKWGLDVGGTPPEPPWDDGAVFSWQLTENLDPGQGDMGAFGLERPASDRTYVASGLELGVARYGPGSNIWASGSDPSDGTGLGVNGAVVFIPYEWPYQPPNGSLVNAAEWPAVVAVNASLKHTHSPTHLTGDTLRISFYVQMKDNSEPVPTTSSNDPASDFRVTIGNAGCNVIGKEHVGNNVWRVWGVRVSTNTNSTHGIDRNTNSRDNAGMYSSGYFTENLG